jgi:hypothetical protein
VLYNFYLDMLQGLEAEGTISNGRLKLYVQGLFLRLHLL